MTIISICESCERGYHRDMTACPWCGAPQFLSVTREATERVLDTECYVNYWLCRVDPSMPGHSGVYELRPGEPMDIMALHHMLTVSTLITFNGDHYDIPMLALALTGADNERLKAASDAIIMQNLQPWEFYDHWGLAKPVWIDTIDLINIAPGQYSLKMYGGKMHSKKLQDLPIEPSATITDEQVPILRAYCANDLAITWDLYRTFPTQIDLRRHMSAEYGIDLRSKSDAQMSEAIMKSLTGVKRSQPVDPGTRFYYQPPPWMKFQNLQLLELIARSPFVVNYKGGIEMTAELEKYHIIVGRTKYHMGIGGLHSTEKGVVHLADDQYSLQDVDVASYYPSLILKTGIIPPALGHQFQPIYGGWFDTRIAAKRAGEKKKADSLKTLLNGTFGKLGSMWSIYYTPLGFIQVVIGGQLSLLMLIEMLELCGIRVVSGNTDGIVIKCPRALEAMRDQIVKWWEQTTGFETEAVNYRAICMRDVNNYIALPLDESKPPKLKGCYARPVPVATSWPNPTGEVCIDALADYLAYGVTMESTIRGCTDFRKFVHVRNVKGGGVWNNYYLGKAVRWYYATGPGTAEIRYKTNGNLVPQSEGCWPVMELPEYMPVNVDYDRYLADARAMLADLGVQG
jgi:hypothetical protein